jgi:NitT/TauT family transport system substrate-binding protein
MKDNPAIIEEERAKRNLLADQPKEILAEVVPFYTEGAKEGLFDPAGGGMAAAKADFAFYTEAGQLQGPAESLKVEEYWDLEPLNAAKKKLGL